MTVQQIVDGARALSCCIPSGLQRSSIVYVLNQLLSGAGGGEGVSLLANLYDHWSFDGTMNGVNGRVFANPATVYGTGHTTPQALSLDGTANNVAKCEAANDLAPNSKYIAGCFWFNFSSVAGGPVIISTRSAAAGVAWTVLINGARFRLQTSALNTVATVMVVGTWYFCAFNCRTDGVNPNFVSFGDGTDNNSTVSIVGGLTASPLTVGARYDLLSAMAAGRINGLTIWTNRQLSLADIAYLYNSGAGRRYPFFI